MEARNDEYYETVLSYLTYEGDTNKIGLPMDLRERHLTQSTKELTLQAIGTDLQISIPSARDHIVIRCPLKEWRQTRPYDRCLIGGNNGQISVGLFEDCIESVEFPEGRSPLGVSSTVRVLGELSIAEQ